MGMLVTAHKPPNGDPWGPQPRRLISPWGPLFFGGGVKPRSAFSRAILAVHGCAQFGGGSDGRGWRIFGEYSEPLPSVQEGMFNKIRRIFAEPLQGLANIRRTFASPF